MRINLGVCRAVHTKGGGSGTSNLSLHESWLGGAENTVLASCPARGSNPGSSNLNSDALTTEPRPPSLVLWLPPRFPSASCSSLILSPAGSVEYFIGVKLIDIHLSEMTVNRLMCYFIRSYPREVSVGFAFVQMFCCCSFSIIIMHRVHLAL